jgi:hypothetical protein
MVYGGGMETSNRPPQLKPRVSHPYSEMTGRQKFFFVVKLAICIVTFGMAFPNVMSD